MEPQIQLKKNWAKAIATLVAFGLIACGERADIRRPPALEAPPLTPWQLNVTWEGAEILSPPRPAEQMWIRLTISNPGPAIWPDPQLANPVELDGSWAVRVTHRFWDETGMALVTDYSDRNDLPGPILVGQRIDLLIAMLAPPHPGHYLLQFDLIRESVDWFEQNNVPKFQIPVEVRP